jgi:hypothetical protein
MIAFTWDRVCRACSTRYTPPTPVWGRAVFAVIGTAAAAFGAWGLYDTFARAKEPNTATGLAPFIVSAVIGLGCWYKAVTK